MPTMSLPLQEAAQNSGCFVSNKAHREKILISLICSLGLNYIIMGQVGEDGRGRIMPNSFIMTFKTKNQKLLNALKNKRCQH